LPAAILGTLIPTTQLPTATTGAINRIRRVLKVIFDFLPTNLCYAHCRSSNTQSYANSNVQQIFCKSGKTKEQEEKSLKKTKSLEVQGSQGEQPIPNPQSPTIR
jgi:hypothetical protein